MDYVNGLKLPAGVGLVILILAAMTGTTQAVVFSKTGDALDQIHADQYILQTPAYDPRINLYVVPDECRTCDLAAELVMSATPASPAVTVTIYPLTSRQNVQIFMDDVRRFNQTMMGLPTLTTSAVAIGGYNDIKRFGRAAVAQVRPPSDDGISEKAKNIVVGVVYLAGIGGVYLVVARVLPD